MGIFRKKKVEKVEKVAPTFEEIKAKVYMSTAKFRQAISKYEQLRDKHLTKATQLTMNGSDASNEIKSVSKYNNYIKRYERNVYMLDTMLERYEEVGLEKEMLTTLQDVVGMFSGTNLDTGEIKKMTEQIGSQVTLVDLQMEEMERAMDSISNLNASDTAMNEAEKLIKAQIEQSINDARLSATTQSAESIANNIKEKIKF